MFRFINIKLQLIFFFENIFEAKKRKRANYDKKKETVMSKENYKFFIEEICSF